MANVQWIEIPFAMNSQFGGSVAFNPFWNGTTGPQWVLQAESCQAGSAKRVTRDNSPQRGGEIVHKHFKTGFVMQIAAIALDITDPVTATDEGTVIVPGSGNAQPVCGSDLVDLDDDLMRCLDGMENLDGNIIWAPTGHDDRAMYGARWLGPDGLGGAAFTAVLEARDTDVFTTVQFALVCPYPYVTTSNNDEDGQGRIVTALGGSDPVVVNNGGTTEYWPVIEVYGPSSGFTIYCTNPTNGTQKIVYDASLPGAVPLEYGDFIEINLFANTAYFNGDGANAKPGIDPTQTDFWSLVPGDNTVEIGGASADMLWNDAWV